MKMPSWELSIIFPSHCHHIALLLNPIKLTRTISVIKIIALKGVEGKQFAAAFTG